MARNNSELSVMKEEIVEVIFLQKENTKLLYYSKLRVPFLWALWLALMITSMCLIYICIIDMTNRDSVLVYELMLQRSVLEVYLCVSSIFSSTAFKSPIQQYLNNWLRQTLSVRTGHSERRSFPGRVGTLKARQIWKGGSNKERKSCI